jgi:hypothetical protein
MQQIFVTLFYVVAIFVDLKPKLKTASKKHITLYIVLIVASYVIIMFNLYGLKLPSPVRPIQTLLENLRA